MENMPKQLDENAKTRKPKSKPLVFAEVAQANEAQAIARRLVRSLSGVEHGTRLIALRLVTDHFDKAEAEEMRKRLSMYGVDAQRPYTDLRLAFMGEVGKMCSPALNQDTGEKATE